MFQQPRAEGPAVHVQAELGQNGIMSGEDTAQGADESEEISIRDDMIRLGQLLKLAALAEDGVEAKALVDNGLVQVNGEIEERRGRQLHPGDMVTVNGQSRRITKA